MNRSVQEAIQAINTEEDLLRQLTQGCYIFTPEITLLKKIQPYIDSFDPHSCKFEVSKE